MSESSTEDLISILLEVERRLRQIENELEAELESRADKTRETDACKGGAQPQNAQQDETRSSRSKARMEKWRQLLSIKKIRTSVNTRFGRPCM